MQSGIKPMNKIDLQIIAANRTMDDADLIAAALDDNLYLRECNLTKVADVIRECMLILGLKSSQ